MSYGLSQDAEMGLPSVHTFENAHVSLILQPHDGGASISDHHLLEGQDVLYVPQCGFAPEHTLKSAERELVQHSNNCVDAGGVGKDPQLIVAGN